MRRIRVALTTARFLRRDSRIPRWTKGMLGVGLLPVPGPLDELVLLLAVALLCVRHRPIVAQAWREAQEYVA